MNKIKIDEDISIYPMPVSLVGTVVNAKVNFMAVSWVSRVNRKPPLLAVGINKKNLTPTGIQENETFSVCFPGAEMLELTDFCGTVSGRNVSKSSYFDTFFGKLGTAPMINECPLCLECSLYDTIELPSNFLFIGEIAGSYTSAEYLSDGILDINKIKPLLLTVPDNNYWTVGSNAGKAFGPGKRFAETAAG